MKAHEENTIDVWGVYVYIMHASIDVQLYNVYMSESIL